MKKILIWTVKFYQMGLSPFMGARCRFIPTCSDYAIDAIEHKGIKGIVDALRRLSRCHPWGKTAGWDPYEK